MVWQLLQPLGSSCSGSSIPPHRHLLQVPRPWKTHRKPGGEQPWSQPASCGARCEASDMWHEGGGCPLPQALSPSGLSCTHSFTPATTAPDKAGSQTSFLPSQLTQVQDEATGEKGASTVGEVRASGTEQSLGSRDSGGWRLNSARCHGGQVPGGLDQQALTGVETSGHTTGRAGTHAALGVRQTGQR